MERDERNLVEACLSGDQRACADLVEAHARMVGTVIWRTIGTAGAVEDLAQETFLRVFRALRYFDGRAKLSTWIYTIAHRVAIDHIQTANFRRTGPLTGEEDDDAAPDRYRPSASADPHVALMRNDAHHVIREGLAQLPQKYRLPLIYSAIEGLDYPTIAEMLNLPIGTVKTLIFRGKRMLKERIIAHREARVSGERPDAM